MPLLLACLLLFVPGLALAHPGHGEASFAAGFAHPLSGADHLLAMVAIGVIAARLPAARAFGPPFAFVGGMLLGALLGLGATSAGVVEIAIAASVIMLGLALMAERVIALPLALVAAFSFGTAHGFAHGAETPVGSALPLALAGILVATALLHAAGVIAGRAARRPGLLALARRGGGGGMALFGLALLLGLA